MPPLAFIEIFVKFLKAVCCFLTGLKLKGPPDCNRWAFLLGSAFGFEQGFSGWFDHIASGNETLPETGFEEGMTVLQLVLFKKRFSALLLDHHSRLELLHSMHADCF